jgi:hypothetical protein
MLCRDSRAQAVHQCGKYSLLTGWVMVGPSVKVEIGIGRFTVHSAAQRTVGSPVNIYVKEGMWPSLSVSMVNGMHWWILFRWFRNSFSLSVRVAR